MKYLVTVGLAGLAIAASQGAVAAEVDAKWAQAELKEHGCLGCHAVDTKKVGPAYKDVAAKFKGKSAADLMTSVKAKPVHAASVKKTSDQDLNMMSEWILTLAK